MKTIPGPSPKISMKCCKRCFTLFEIVISMFLLCLISSLFIYKGWELINEHRYLSSCRLVQNEIYAAKLNALSFGHDFTFKFTPEGSKTKLFIECFDPPKLLKSRVNRNINLPNLRLEGEIIFYANGYFWPQDQIICRPIKGNSKPREISLVQIDRMKVKENVF